MASSSNKAETHTSNEVAEHWAKLIEAAEAGDERAKEFLDLFGPWAQERLKDWPRQ